MTPNYKDLSAATESVITQQQDLACGNVDDEYNNQLKQLMELVKKSNCKFGDFSRVEDKEVNLTIVE